MVAGLALALCLVPMAAPAAEPAPDFGPVGPATGIVRPGAVVWMDLLTGDVDLDNLTPGGTVEPYPDLETELTSLKLRTLYHYRPNLGVRLTYWYEKYSADNWALDSVQPDSVPDLLLFGEETPDYDVHAISASVLFYF